MDIQNLKKAELHCHIDGLLNPEILKRIPSDSEIHGLVPDLNAICPIKNFDDWANHYNPIIYPIFKNKGELLLQILIPHIQHLKKQHVIYSEIMLSIFNMQHDDMDQQISLYHQYRDTIDCIAGDDLQVEFLFAFGRTNDRKKIEQKAERILTLVNLGIICGVAIAGLEEPETIKPYKDIFEQFHQAGLGIEIHAGEWKGPEYIWEALEYGYAQRIGHGLAAFDDPILLQYIKMHNIHLEFCPSSNLLLTKYKDISQHPIRFALEEGVSFSINTDDPGPFCTNMNQEYAIVQKAFNLNKKDFDKILVNSLNAAFGKLKFIQC